MEKQQQSGSIKKWTKILTGVGTAVASTFGGIEVIDLYKEIYSELSDIKATQQQILTQNENTQYMLRDYVLPHIIGHGTESPE